MKVHLKYNSEAPQTDILMYDWWSLCKITHSCNLGYIDQTRKQLKVKLDEHHHKVKNEEIYSSSITSHCWSYNHFFDFTKANIMPSPISTSHLNFYEAFYSLKNSNNLINDFSFILSFSETWKIACLIFCNYFYFFYLFIFIYYIYVLFIYLFNFL